MTTDMPEAVGRSGRPPSSPPLCSVSPVLRVDVRRGIITCGKHRSFVAKTIARKIESLLLSPNDPGEQRR